MLSKTHELLPFSKGCATYHVYYGFASVGVHELYIWIGEEMNQPSSDQLRATRVNGIKTLPRVSEMEKTESWTAHNSQ